MIVLDASAVVELILATTTGRRIASRIADPTIALHVPHLVDMEVTQALRRCAASGEIDADDATLAITALRELPLERHGHDALLDRVWALYSADGRCIDGKSTTALHHIRATFAPDLSSVTLSAPDDPRSIAPQQFRFPDETASASGWLADTSPSR